jgi:hypothetical protein
VKTGKRVDEKGQKEFLEARKMGCITGEEGRVKSVRVEMRE